MGAWTELQNYTVPSTTTAVTLNNFGTITKDDFVRIVITLNASQSIDLKLYGNSVTGDSNYWHQYLYNDGTDSYAGQRAFPLLGDIRIGTSAVLNVYLKLSQSNKLVTFAYGDRRHDSSLALDYAFTTSLNDFTGGITSLTFQGQISNGIGSGTRIQIYRLDAEKVADITVANTANQIDLTGFEMNKGSKYLLIADTISANDSNDFSVMPNDLTTQTQYYTQYLQGSNTSRGAGRLNFSSINFHFSTTGINSLAYVYINLSQIGAYTHQSHMITRVGLSNPVITNYVTSSTYENLTSINKLNILAFNKTNGIGAGTRFMLYKLY